MPWSGARPTRHRIGAKWPEGGDPGRQARQARSGRRAQGAPRRRLHPHRHHPLQDAARGGARAARPAPARRARPDAGGGVRAGGARAADGPYRARRGRRDRGGARAVPPQPRGLAPRRGALRGREHGQDARRRRADPRSADHHRLRDAAGAAVLGPVRRQDGHRLRRPAQARAPRAALDGRRRAPGSSASSTRRCSARSGRRSRWSTSATACSASSTARSARPSSTCCGARTSPSACASRSPAWTSTSTRAARRCASSPARS